MLENLDTLSLQTCVLKKLKIWTHWRKSKRTEIVEGFQLFIRSVGRGGAQRDGGGEGRGGGVADELRPQRGRHRVHQGAGAGQKSSQSGKKKRIKMFEKFLSKLD